jgi:hypothetical protein
MTLGRHNLCRHDMRVLKLVPTAAAEGDPSADAGLVVNQIMVLTTGSAAVKRGTVETQGRNRWSVGLEGLF